MRDLEMADLRPKEDSLGQGSIQSMWGPSSFGGRSGRREEEDEEGGNPFRRWLDSFRRDPDRHVTPPNVLNTAAVWGDGWDRGRRRQPYEDEEEEENERDRLPRGRWRGPYFDMYAANYGTANTLLSRKLKGRHLQMIAIGGSIGR